MKTPNPIHSAHSETKELLDAPKKTILIILFAALMLIAFADSVRLFNEVASTNELPNVSEEIFLTYIR